MRQTLSGLLLAVSGLCIGSGLQAQERARRPRHGASRPCGRDDDSTPCPETKMKNRTN